MLRSLRLVVAGAVLTQLGCGGQSKLTPEASGGGPASASGGAAGETCTTTLEDRDGDGRSRYHHSAACHVSADQIDYGHDCDDADATRQRPRPAGWIA